MKIRINRKLYDTDTAQYIGSWENSLGYHDYGYLSQDLYLKKTGEFFLVNDTGSCAYEGWEPKDSIESLSLDEAKEWAEQHLSVDTYISTFGEVDE